MILVAVLMQNEMKRLHNFALRYYLTMTHLVLSWYGPLFIIIAVMIVTYGYIIYTLSRKVTYLDCLYSLSFPL